MAEPAHCLLRRATARLHGRLDRRSVLTGLLSPGVTRQLYIAAMQCLNAAYDPVDALLLRREDLCPEDVPPYTPRTPGIGRDLIALGAERSLNRGHDSQGNQWKLSGPGSPAAYLGMRYVVEGAQLGGRVIHRRLLEAFGVGFQEFGSFWSPDPAIQSSWPAVLKSLTRVESRDSLAEAARSARSTFRHMKIYLAVRE